MTNEDLKAIEEAAKTAGKAIDVSEKLASFFKKVCGDAIVEAGGVLTDWARFFRYKNLLLIHDKVNEIHQKRKVEGKTTPIPARYAIPLIQKASTEDEESLQVMWAGLIANATDPNKRLEVKRIQIQILSELEPLDAHVLEFFSKQGWLMIRGPHSKGFSLERLSEELNVPREDLQISIENLARLGCILAERPVTYDDRHTSGVAVFFNNPNTTFRLSHLGSALLEACTV